VTVASLSKPTNTVLDQTLHLQPIGHSIYIRELQPEIPPKHSKCTQVVPPPHKLHVDPRVKPQKIPILNSPVSILFVNQRETTKFLQNFFLHLVTLFSVRLRVLPFSEVTPQNQITKNLFKVPQLTINSAISHRPLIRDRKLILFYPSPVICNSHF
jgi:hypothetical protein